MLLFNRILDFEPDKVVQMGDQRLDQRYTPGPAFPLQAWLVINGKEWPAKVANLSSNGIGLTVDPAAQPTARELVKIKLSVGKHQQVISAQLKHVRPASKGVYCGIGMNFDNFIVQKIYLQLLQPIIIGQSLQPVAADLVIQNEPQLIKQVYRGEDQAVLTVWLGKSPGTPVHSFEFQMHDFFCRADAVVGVLEAYSREPTDSFKGKLSNPVFDISGGLQDEIRQLFRWILPNLPPAIPDDVRMFLQRFAK